MAFSDPLSITVAGSAKSMPRVETAGRQSIYQSADGLFTQRISHQTTKSGGKERIRSLVAFDQKAIVADPLTAEQDYDDLAIQITFNRPVAGFTSTNMADLWAAIKTQLDTTFIGKIYGQES